MVEVRPTVRFSRAAPPLLARHAPKADTFAGETTLLMPQGAASAATSVGRAY